MGKWPDQRQRLMELKGVRPRTRKIFLFCVRHFVGYYDRSPTELGTEESGTDRHPLLRERQRSPSSLSQQYRALKLLYETVQGQPWEAGRILRVKRAKKLPVMLSEAEVQRLRQRLASSISMRR